MRGMGKRGSLENYVVRLGLAVAVPFFAGCGVYGEPKEIEPEGVFASAGQIGKFEDWAGRHNIRLMGVRQEPAVLLEEDVGDDKIAGLDEVLRLQRAAEALYKIPDYIMEVMYGKTIYLSTVDGQSLAFSNSLDNYDDPPRISRGFALGQPINASTTLLEFFHIVYTHGIQGRFDDRKHLWPELEEMVKEVFVPPDNIGDLIYEGPDGSERIEGFINYFSTTGVDHDVTFHLVAYVIDSVCFRERSEVEPALDARYRFILDFFKGREYEGDPCD